MIKHIWICPLVFGGAAGTAVAQPSIEDLAPEDSVLIVSVSDFQRSLDRFKRTHLWGLWRSRQVRAMFQEPLRELNDELDDVLEDIGVDRDALVTPTGSVGLAVFPGRRGDPNASPGFLVMADFGARAHKANRIIDALIERAEDDGEIQFDRRDVFGRTVYSFDMADLELAEGLEFEEPPFPMDPLIPDPGDLIGVVQKVHYVRDGRRFMLCSDFRTLRTALELVDEDDRSGLAERLDFRGAVAQLGDVDAYGVLLVRDLARLLGDGDPMAMMFQAMIQSLVGDIHALSCGVRLDGPAGMVEETFGMYMPNGTSGLTALLDTETPRGELPPFVTPGAIAYSRVNFEFDGIVGFLRAAGQANPMIGAQIDQWLFDHGQEIEKVCAALGPQVHSVVTLERPITLTSLQSLYAIRSGRPDDIEDVLSRHAAEIGMQPRDFLGHRIYSMAVNPMMMAGQPPGGQDLSIGIGGGYVMIGSTGIVEDALRASGRDNAPTLSDNPEVARAMRALHSRQAVAWGVMDIVEYMEFFRDFADLSTREMIKQIRQWDPEYAEEMEAELENQEPAPWETLDLKILRRYLGPISWDVRAGEDGFTGRYLMLPPMEATVNGE